MLNFLRRLELLGCKPGRRFSGRSRRPVASCQRTFRAALEVLEDRWLPTTIVVTSTADGTGIYDSINHTDTTLRGAIANASAGDTIAFQSGVTGTITLT